MAARRETLAGGAATEERLEQCRKEMEAARGRVAAWRIEVDGFEAVAGGMGRTYKRVRRAMRTAYLETTADAFHEWRKRAKYHRATTSACCGTHGGRFWIPGAIAPTSRPIFWDSTMGALVARHRAYWHVARAQSMLDPALVGPETDASP